MVKDLRKGIDVFRQGLGASPYQGFIDRQVFRKPRQMPPIATGGLLDDSLYGNLFQTRQFGQILPGEEDVSRGGRFLGDTLRGIDKALQALSPGKTLPSTKNIEQAISFLREKPQSQEVLEEALTAQKEKDFRSRVVPSGVLGLQDEIDKAAEQAKQAQKDVLKGELTELKSLPEGIGVAAPSFVSEDVPKDFDTIERSLPGDFESLKEEREPSITDKKVLGEGSNEETAEDLLNNSLIELYGVSEPLTGEERTKAMEQYKKDFYQATGLDSSGKPDMKDAMVAFGLALMQNKAGKKLNIGKIFGEVGKAGQTALPLASEARKQAESRKIAAGQFALSELGKEDERRREAKKLERETRLSLELDAIKRSRDLQQELAKLKIKGSTGEVEKLLNVITKDIEIPGGKIKISRGTDNRGRRIFVDPLNDFVPLSNAFAKTEGGLNAVEAGFDLIDEIAKAGESTVGGTAGFLTTSSILKYAKVIGMNVEDFVDEETQEKFYTELKDGTKVLKRDKLQSIQKGLIARFKRYLTQETGNGISNVDVESLRQLTGSLDNILKNPSQAKSDLLEVKGMFLRSRAELNAIIRTFTDRSEYKAGSLGDEEYQKVLTRLDEDLDKYFKTNVEFTTKDGQIFIDLTKGA